MSNASDFACANTHEEVGKDAMTVTDVSDLQIYHQKEKKSILYGKGHDWREG